jgi:hypothetical protein
MVTLLLLPVLLLLLVVLLVVVLLVVLLVLLVVLLLVGVSVVGFLGALGTCLNNSAASVWVCVRGGRVQVREHSASERAQYL